MIFVKLTALCFLVFVRSIRGPIRLHDDQISIIVQEYMYLTPDTNWRYYFRFGYSGRSVFDYVNFWSYRIFGFRPEPWHAVNYGLHAIATCLVYLTLERLHIANPDWLAVAFAVHPFQGHSVNYISGRSGILAASFLLIFVLTYLLDFPYNLLSPLPLWLAYLSREDALIALAWMPFLEWFR